MKKRILIFSLAFKPFLGGAEIAIKEITDRISPTELEFDMITLRFDSNLPKFERVGNINVYRIGFSKKSPTMTDLVKFPMYLNKVFFPVTAFFKARTLDRKQNYNALWCMMSYTGFPALFLNWFGRRIPIILTLQEGDSISHITKRLRIRIVFPLYRAIFKKASVVQAISTFLGRFARDMGFRGRIEIIPNAVDTKLFSERISDKDLSDLKQKMDKKDGDVFLITTSRLVPKNAVGDVIDSLKHLPENYKFIILGIGPLENSLKSKTDMLHLNHRVRFLGEVEHKIIPTYLQVSDIFIRPSLSEGMGNSFIEAMAAGIPVVGTAVGGITDFLKDRSTGVVCKVGDSVDIAQKIKLLVENSSLREKVIKEARALAFEKYDWNLISKEMKERVFQKAFFC